MLCNVLLGVTAELNLSLIYAKWVIRQQHRVLLHQDRSPQKKLNPEQRSDSVLRCKPEEILTEYKVNAG